MKLSREKKHHSKPTKNGKLLFFSIVLSYLFIPTAIYFCFAEEVITDLNPTILFQPPPESEQPENTESAASRNSSSDRNQQCFRDSIATQEQQLSTTNQSMTAIVPNTNYGLTLTERPTFWVYLPQTSASQIILSIKKEGSQPHWQQSVNLTKKAGIIGIKLSDDAPALEIGKNYQWAMILVCEDRPTPNDPVVTSWIKRIERSQTTGNWQTELEKASNYARQGIWYGALDILIATQTSSIANWQNLWFEYLQSGNLDKIANEPILGTIP